MCRRLGGRALACSAVSAAALILLIGVNAGMRAEEKATGPAQALFAASAGQAEKTIGVPAVPSGEAEPLYRGTFCRYKSPGPGMTFTQGVPLRVLADAIDLNGWQGKTKKMEAAEVRFFVDGDLKARVEPAPDGYNYFETVFKDLSAGNHVLTLESTNFGGVIAKSLPVAITVEPPVTRANTVTLTQDLVLTGATNLTWEKATVRGNGFKVRSDANWTGSVVIRDSFVTGLGNYAVSGIDVATRGGSVVIEDTIFEGTGAVFVRVDGTGGITVRKNEFRSSNLIKFVSSNPGMSPVFLASGNTTGVKVFQANRVGAGIVRFEGMSGWLIGGSTDAESNILIGPRCVIALAGCRNLQVRGNYMNHDYYGGWSQGFNLYCENCQDILAEHNVIRHSSWPVQSFAGEFRYNLIVDSGHNWVRTLTTGTKMHHNLLVHASHGGGVNSGVWLYNGRKDVAIYNNTFDGGSPVVRAFESPMIEISTGCSLSSLRNNIFTGLAAPENVLPRPVVARGANEKDSDSRVAYADYNCFFNPQSPRAAHYADGIAADKTPGTHDVDADPRYAEGRIIPYPVNQAEVWKGNYKVSQVLTYYRERYVPAGGSPVIGAGDPADGKSSYIGAIGPGKDAPDDLFGRFGTLADSRDRR